MMIYRIESRDPAELGDVWHLCAMDGGDGDNEFLSRESAEEMIPKLRRLGSDWAADEYRVAEIAVT